MLIMNNDDDKNEIKELMMSMIYQMEAITNLLDRKGIIAKNDLLEEMKQIHKDLMIDKGKNE